MFMKLFGMPDFAVLLDENEAERLTRVIAADRILRRARAQWGVRKTAAAAAAPVVTE